MHICKKIFLISLKNKTNHFLSVAHISLKISELWLFNYYFLWFKIDFQDFLIKMNQYVNFHKNLRTCPKKMFRFPCRKTARCKDWFCFHGNICHRNKGKQDVIHLKNLFKLISTIFSCNQATQQMIISLTFVNFWHLGLKCHRFNG